MVLDAAGNLDLKTGGFLINGTQVVNSSRQLINIAGITTTTLLATQESASAVKTRFIMGKSMLATLTTAICTSTMQAVTTIHRCRWLWRSATVAGTQVNNSTTTFHGTTTHSGNNLAIFGPNTGWSRSLAIGGNANNSTSTRASIGATNGNLHIDAATGNFGTYLNYYDGTEGVWIGSGSTSAVAKLENDGRLNLTGSGGAATGYALSVNGTGVLSTGRALQNVTGLDMTATSTADVDLNRSGWITFYGNGAQHHAIGSRNNIGGADDDIRINSYGAVWVNLDSNGNDSNANHSSFFIGKHGQATFTISYILFKVDGETADVTTSGNVTAYGSPSDIRLKENIERIADPIDKVKKLDGITFTYKKDGSRSATGLIAQQLLEVLPEVVYETEDLQTEESSYAVAQELWASRWSACRGDQRPARPNRFT